MKKLRITVESRTYDVTVEELEDSVNRSAPAAFPTQVPRPFVSVVSTTPAAPLPRAASSAPPRTPAPAGVLSPLSGIIVSVDVRLGQKVAEGDKLLCLEAMKMNSDVLAPRAGEVRAINVEVGASVQEGQVLVSLG